MARCLLIAPLTFYSFHHTVREALEARGYQVDLLNDEFPANSFGKVLGKTALPLLRRLTLRGLKKRLTGGERYDLVLIIKGRGLGREAIAYLRTIADRIVGYNFDSFSFNASPLDWHDLTDHYATFDIVDAKVRRLPLVHLFSAALQDFASDERAYDLSVVMRVHSDRLAYVEQVMKALPDARRFVFLYESSYLTFILDLVRHPLLYLRLRRYISFTPLAYHAAMEALAKSRVTLDYAHPLQSGITVRCFEAQSLGVAVVTNNPQLVQSDVFDADACAYFPLGGDAVALATAFKRLGQARPAPRVRTTDDFISELLAEPAGTRTSAHEEDRP